MYLDLIPEEALDWMDKVCDAPDFTSNADRIRFLSKKLQPYGFHLEGSGTNRVVYTLKGTSKYNKNFDICFKVALDSRGKKDNLQEYNLFIEAPTDIIAKKYFIEVFELSEDCLIAVERKADCVMDMYTAKRMKNEREKMFRDLDEYYLLDDASPYGNCAVIRDYDVDGNEVQKVCMIDYANFVKKEGLHLFCTSDECYGIEDESTYLIYNPTLTGMVCPNCGKQYSFADVKGTGHNTYTETEAVTDFLGSVKNIRKSNIRKHDDVNSIIMDEITEIYRTGLMFTERERVTPKGQYDDIYDEYSELLSGIADEDENTEEDDDELKEELAAKSSFIDSKRMSNSDVLAQIYEMKVDHQIEEDKSSDEEEYDENDDEIFEKFYRQNQGYLGE